MDLLLEEYALSGTYPFHMPGHKRNALSMPNPYTIDITEIDGFDNLHAPEGVLKDAMERAAKLYGAKKSYYLVNGSTCGILAAVSAAVPSYGKLMMSRNSHKSVYHAVYLRNLTAVYLTPNISEFGIHGSIQPEEVKRMLKKNPDTKAVLITSPAYEGIVSDILEISRIVHEYNIPLIVDEAHGAHFGFHGEFPKSAVCLGADVVIQSLHKVLPSLTQTALLHINSGLILPEAIQKYLDIYETSSPSYVLMGGIEKCIRMLKEEGDKLFSSYNARLDSFYQNTEKFSHIHIMKKSDFTPDEIYDLDKSKIVISVRETNISGKKLYQILLEKFKLQMELYSNSYVLAMTSIMDSDEGFERLFWALKEIDETLFCDKRYFYGDSKWLYQLYLPKEKKMELGEAMEQQVTAVPFDKAAGEISGSMVLVYPPGIPILLPGEVIDSEVIKNIRKCIQYQLNLQGIADIINETINIVNSKRM